MKKILFSFLALLLSASPAWAAQVDTTKSTVQWMGEKITGKHSGTVPLKSATLTEENGQITGGAFEVDMTNIQVTDLTGEDAQKLAGHLKNADFFDVAKYPTAKLVITKIEGNKATGTLTIKDKTNPITFDFVKEEAQGSANYKAKLIVDRTKYGVVYNSGNFFKDLGDKVIKDEMILDIALAVK